MKTNGVQYPVSMTYEAQQSAVGPFDDLGALIHGAGGVVVNVTSTAIDLESLEVTEMRCEGFSTATMRLREAAHSEQHLGMALAAAKRLDGRPSPVDAMEIAEHLYLWAQTEAAR